MPGATPRIPKMTHHKASGQAVVRLSQRDHYLGNWGTNTAKAEYDRLVAEWLANGRRALGGDGADRGGPAGDGKEVAEILAAFLDHAERYYRLPDGSTSTEVTAYRDAMKPLRRLYGHTLAAQFGPLALKAVREEMIRIGWCRKRINRQVGRVKHIFKWSVENELVPPAVFHGLQAVAGLRVGRSDARESEPVRPVADVAVEAVIPLVSRQVAAMIRLQQLTGMRSGEVTQMRGVDIDMTGRLWVYRPARHKTQHHGHDRAVYLGPKAQAILEPFLKRDVSAYLFSPAEAEAERLRQKHERRKTPLSCGNRPGSKVIGRAAVKRPTDRYHTTSYARAIKYACERLYPLPTTLGRRMRGGRLESAKEWRARLTGDERKAVRAWRKAHSWHPHQLRHSAATNLRKIYGLEPAQVILGHRTIAITQLYAQKSVEAAERIMAEIG